MLSQSDLAPVAAPSLDATQEAHAQRNLATLEPVRALCDARSASAFAQLETLARTAAAFGLDVYCYAPLGYAYYADAADAWVIWVDQEWPDVDGRTCLSTYLAAGALQREAAMKAQIAAWRRLMARRAGAGATRWQTQEGGAR